jgi:chromosome segregation ATPase
MQNEQEKWNQSVESLKSQQDTQSKEHETAVNQLNKIIQELQESNTNTHVRKLQNELDTANAALDEFKLQSQQAVEAIERRYRDEIRQLQTGSDDTADVWLEKTRSAQQQVNRLSDELERNESKHKEEMATLSEQHQEAIEQFKEDIERKDGEIEAQSNQIEQLLFQVESLQNSLEAATARLEHTTKSSSSTTTGNQANENSHKDCLARLEQKQKEVDDVRARISEIREAHESQLTLMGQEKANAMQEMRKTITALEQKLASIPALAAPTPAPSQPQTPILLGIDEGKLKSIAEQHRQEIKTLHDQYQAVVDSKEKELEDYSYRVKALVASKQKELDKMRTEGSQKEGERQEEVNRYEHKIKGMESKVNKLETNVHHWMTISNNKEVLLQDMKKDCNSHVDENQQLVRLVDQLQNELHRGRLAV